MKIRAVACFIVLMLSATFARGQRVELAALGGGVFSSASSLGSIDAAGAIEGSVALRIFHVPLAGLYVELPVAREFQTGASFSVTSLLCPGVCTTPAARPKFSSLFVAPGVKLKVGASLPLSPFVTAGAGVAHFDQTDQFSAHSTSNTPVVQFGGGADLKIFPFVGVRAELRDYWAGAAFGRLGRQQNVFAGAGVVVRF